MKWIFGGITVWLIFVLSLSTWWMIFGLNTLSQLGGNATAEGGLILRQQKMLFYEGSVLALMQVLGAVFLFYFSYRMYQEKASAENFFASFTHDLKTSLFRLQLQVEGLSRSEFSKEGEEILSKTRRLHLNLENGLDAILGKRKSLFLESIPISEFVSDLHSAWPDLQIQLRGDGHLKADRKALRSVFDNLLLNSALHGKAEQVFIHIEVSSGKSGLWLRYSDNGVPFSGPLTSLGKKPSTSEKGSGYGLYLVRFWMERMRGKLRFSQGENGALAIGLFFPEGVA